MLNGQGFEFDHVYGEIIQSQLYEYDILLIDLPYYTEGKQRFTLSEMELVKEYIKQGGGVLLIGLGWVWVTYGEEEIENYPLNFISKDFGIWFSDDNVWDTANKASPTFYPPFLNTDHPLTEGVKMIASPEIPLAVYV
jgi:uncharacterized membrane protein